VLHKSSSDVLAVMTLGTPVTFTSTIRLAISLS
jgi:hypothetical protein